MFPCLVCDVKLNSEEQLRAHCRGKNHIKREEARKKAQELGTDFNNTPERCDVCNVPLTSKMTAIDHFKGKMHQKKVKAVEEQRKGYKNNCEICEVRLQSLKVSEAHFNGKKHHKRERKAAKGQSKRSQIDRKFNNRRTSRSSIEDFSPCEKIFGVVFEETLEKSSPWENCDNDSEANDLLSEFRSILSGKSLNSLSSSNSSSPETSTEPFFCFDNPESLLHQALEIPIPGRSPPVVEQPPNGLIPYFNGEDLPNVMDNATLESLWESQGIQHLNTAYNPGLPPSNTEFISAQSELLVQTQAVINALKGASQGISSGDIAIDIAGLSPSDVNLILNDLEKHDLVVKSGNAPILWSLVERTDCTVPISPSKQSHKTLNGFSHPRKTSIPSPKEAQYFGTSNDSYFNKHGQNNFSTNEAYTTRTAAILSSCSINTTTTTGVRPYADVIESNVVSVLQQCGSLTVYDIKTKLDLRDETTLCFVLQKLLECNVIVKDGDQRWRLAGSTPSSVGVIGEERKRRSPIQNEGFEISRDRPLTPPKENSYQVQNGYNHTNKFLKTSVSSPIENRVPNGFHVPGITPIENGARIPNGFRNSKTFLPKNGYVEADKCNGFWQSVNNSEMNAVQASHSETNNKQHNRLSPPLTLKTESSEVLDDLTVTTPKSYVKELYEKAMEEDTVCYLSCGTGKHIVMAQVIAHMAILNPSKHALVIVPDIVSALNVAQVLRKELGSKNKRKKLNVTLRAGQLKQSTGKVEVVVITTTLCLGLLNCGALLWKDVCLLIFDNALMCCNDDAAKKIIHQYYLKAKMDFCNGHVPKLLSFLDSSAGQENLEKTKRTFYDILSTMGDVCLSCVSKSVDELQEDKREAMFVCVQTDLNEEELKMFFLLVYYLRLVFDNLAAQWQPLNSYRELLRMSFEEKSVNTEAFVKLIHLTGQPPEKRLPQSCLKTWRHYLAICEVIFSLVECGEDLAKELLLNLTREPFGFACANDVGLPGFELSRQLIKEKDISNSGLSNPRGSGLCGLLDQLMIIPWENARVSSERPLALVIVKLSKTANMLANYLARCPQLAKRNVKTTFVDGSRSHQQKAVISAIKRRQYQVIVSTDNIDEDLPHWELVVLLDQPSSVHALEQLRTKHAKNVVALCRDGDGEDKLKELLRREELAEKAITHIRAT